jgi:hypothetical protein
MEIAKKSRVMSVNTLFTLAQRLESAGYWQKTLTEPDYRTFVAALNGGEWARFISGAQTTAAPERPEATPQSNANKRSRTKSSSETRPAVGGPSVARAVSAQSDATTKLALRVRALLFCEMASRSLAARGVSEPRFDDMFYTLDEHDDAAVQPQGSVGVK